MGPNNEYHDTISDYSISPIQGGKWIKDTDEISFNNGGYITISALNDEFINKILLSLYQTPFYNDIKVTGIEFINEKFYNGWNHFATLSPFIIKNYSIDKGFWTLYDEGFEAKVKDYLLSKLINLNPLLDIANFDVVIPKSQKNKVKKIKVKEVINLANQCQVSVNCDRKTAKILYNIGLGQSTGAGFGTIYKTENHDTYGR